MQLAQVLLHICEALQLGSTFSTCTCAGTSAALYRALAAVAGLPPDERPEGRLLVVETAAQRGAHLSLMSPYSNKHCSLAVHVQRKASVSGSAHWVLHTCPMPLPFAFDDASACLHSSLACCLHNICM